MKSVVGLGVALVVAVGSGCATSNKCQSLFDYERIPETTWDSGVSSVSGVFQVCITTNGVLYHGDQQLSYDGLADIAKIRLKRSGWLPNLIVWAYRDCAWKEINRALATVGSQDEDGACQVYFVMRYKPQHNEEQRIVRLRTTSAYWRTFPDKKAIRIRVEANGVVTVDDVELPAGPIEMVKKTITTVRGGRSYCRVTIGADVEYSKVAKVLGAIGDLGLGISVRWWKPEEATTVVK